MVLRRYYTNRSKKFSIALADNSILFERMPLEIMAERTSKSGARNFDRLVQARRGSLVGTSRLDVGSEFGEMLRPQARQEWLDSFDSALKQRRNGRLVSETVYRAPDVDYEGMRLFLSRDGKTGYALKPTRDRAVQRAAASTWDNNLDVELVAGVGQKGGDSAS